jgi:hypothetical protein
MATIEMLDTEWLVEFQVHESQAAKDEWDWMEARNSAEANEHFRRLKHDPSVIAVRILRKEVEVWEEFYKATTPST